MPDDSLWKWPDVWGELTHDETLGLGSFYFNFVEPLMERYARWALNNLAREVGEDAPRQVELTRADEIRLIRAIYRFQLLGQLQSPDSEARSGGGAWVAMSKFVEVLEPWEFEELLSFYSICTWCTEYMTSLLSISVRTSPATSATRGFYKGGQSTTTTIVS